MYLCMYVGICLQDLLMNDFILVPFKLWSFASLQQNWRKTLKPPKWGRDTRFWAGSPVFVASQISVGFFSQKRSLNVPTKNLMSQIVCYIKCVYCRMMRYTVDERNFTNQLRYIMESQSINWIARIVSMNGSQTKKIRGDSIKKHKSLFSVVHF